MVRFPDLVRLLIAGFNPHRCGALLDSSFGAVGGHSCVTLIDVFSTCHHGLLLLLPPPLLYLIFAASCLARHRVSISDLRVDISDAF